MSKTAYDECYIDAMIQKSRYLFKLIGRNTKETFQVIDTYLRSEYRRQMDEGNPLYLNKTPKQILGSLGLRVKTEFGMSEDFDESILEWMSDIYTYLQWKYNLSSAFIADRIKPEELYEKYYPLHEASLENAADKLLDIYGAGQE